MGRETVPRGKGPLEGRRTPTGGRRREGGGAFNDNPPPRLHGSDKQRSLNPC